MGSWFGMWAQKAWLGLRFLSFYWSSDLEAHMFVSIYVKLDGETVSVHGTMCRHTAYEGYLK